MACTFTALKGAPAPPTCCTSATRRAYRLRRDRLTRLTKDHAREGGPGHLACSRARSAEARTRASTMALEPMALHDRFLLCSDGVHGVLTDDAIAEALRQRSAPDDTARALVTAALDAGSADNCTALVMDVVALPTAASADVGGAIMQLPPIATPGAGETVDGFALKALISEGRYSRLFGAVDEVEGGEAALKFPKTLKSPPSLHPSRRVRARGVGRGRMCTVRGWRRSCNCRLACVTCLYTVMPLYQGASFWRRALYAARRLAWRRGRGDRGVGLARGVAALHRLGVIHRDIKPDNVILEGGGKLKLVDLGVVRVPGWEDFPPEHIPGTPAYMAPEMFEGEVGNEATDIYALGVTMFRAFTGEFPYGNPDATSLARRRRPAEGPRRLAPRSARPGWERWFSGGRSPPILPNAFRDATEFAAEMEAGAATRAGRWRVARRRFSSARQYASGKVSPRCWRWRFSGRFFGGDRVNQHPPVLGRPA